MLKNHLEHIVIHALSKPLNHSLVKECLAFLNDYQMIEDLSDGSIRFDDPALGVTLSFDENDIFIKIEINSNPSKGSAFEELLQKYHDREKIYQHLGKPKITQNTLLVYDLKTYWMRFELQENRIEKIVYLALSTIGKGYRNKDVILRTCKSSGKR